jgi:hypothetical protein
MSGISKKRLSKTGKCKSDRERIPKTTGRKRIEDPERCDPGFDIHHGISGTFLCRNSPRNDVKTRRNKEGIGLYTGFITRKRDTCES